MSASLPPNVEMKEHDLKAAVLNSSGHLKFESPSLRRFREKEYFIAVKLLYAVV